MRLEAVTVCVGYGDFLAQTLPENLPLVDDLVVITDPEDEETRAVCRHHNVHHVLSEDHKRGGPFNKARLINRGFDQLGCQDWILHVDADMVLPRQFRRMLDWAHIDPRCIYGADRQRIIGWDQWNAFRRNPGYWNNHAHEMGHWFHPQLPVMSRLVSSIHGYTPIGAFQLFHGSELIQHNMHLRKYLPNHGDAARTDQQFSLQWDRRFRQVLPEVICIHLETNGSTHGANWAGRTTARFGPAWDAAHPLHPSRHHRHRHPSC